MRILMLSVGETAPGERVHELAAELARAGHHVDLVAPEQRTPQYLQKFVEDEIMKWASPIKAAGISAD